MASHMVGTRSMPKYLLDLNYFYYFVKSWSKGNNYT